MIQSLSSTVTGNSTSYLGSRCTGRILAVKAVADASVSANWDLALTGETTGIAILTDITVTENTTTWWHPRALVAKVTDGSAGTDAFVEIPIYRERIKCVIANAGTTGVITVTVLYDAEE